MDQQTAVLDLIPDANSFHLEVAGVLYRDDERHLVHPDHLDRVDLAINGVLYHTGDQTASDATGAAEDHIQDLCVCDQPLRFLIETQFDIRFSPAREIDAADKRWIVRTPESERGVYLTFAKPNCSSYPVEFAA